MMDIPCCNVHNFTTSLQCSFVKNNSDCQEVEGFLNYINFVYCDFHNSLVPVMICVLWMFILFITLGTTADEYFCPSLEVISKVLKLSHNVAGVTFLAFGNGAPDIFSSLAGTQQMRPELVIGALLGAGIFVTCVVAGSVILAHPFKMVERPFFRDVIFYLAAVFWTFYLFYTEHVTFFHALGFIMLYVAYIIVVLVGHHVYQKYLKPRNVVAKGLITAAPVIIITDVDDMHSLLHEDKDIIPWGSPIRARRLSSGSLISNSARSTNITPGNVTPINNLTVPGETTPLLSSVTTFQNLAFRQSQLGKFIHKLNPINVYRWPTLSWWQKCWLTLKFPLVLILNLTIPVVNYEEEPLNNWNRPVAILHCHVCPVFFIFAIGCGEIYIGKIVPLWSILLLVGFIVGMIVLYSSEDDAAPCYHSVFAFVGFATSVTWIYLVANEIVSVLKTIGVVFHLSDSILGLTVLAWGNSLGDLIVNVATAKQGYPRMGFSACFGGPLFNLLLGIGIPFSIVSFEQKDHLIKVIYNSSINILSGFLCASLVSSLVIIPLLKFNLRRFYGVYLIILYLSFVTISIMNELNVI